MKRAALVAAALAVAFPAAGAPCPHGQFFRVHLRQCVDARSQWPSASSRFDPRAAGAPRAAGVAAAAAAADEALTLPDLDRQWLYQWPISASRRG